MALVFFPHANSFSASTYGVLLRHLHARGLHVGAIEQVGMLMTEPLTRGRITMVDGSPLFPMEKPAVTAAAIEASVFNLARLA